MIEMQMENERVERLQKQRLGEDWIGAVKDRALDRLALFCNPRVTGRLLLPGGLVTVNNAADLVAKYQGWFSCYISIQVEASRIAQIGTELGIFYRLLLLDGSASDQIEQQLYCTLKDGYVAQLHLLCSGFQLVGTAD